METWLVFSGRKDTKCLSLTRGDTEELGRSAIGCPRMGIARSEGGWELTVVVNDEVVREGKKIWERVEQSSEDLAAAELAEQLGGANYVPPIGSLGT